MTPSNFAQQTYAQRAGNFYNAAAKQLLETMERKKSNLCVSVDVTKSSDFISVIDTVGPYVALIKTHIDVLDDFEPSVIDTLTSLSKKHDFLIFEDRKFADIGNTVALQYSSGIYKIASWSQITNAHPVPGPSVVTGLASVGLPLGRGLLLLAEMSTKGSLAVGEYTKSSVRMALDDPEFVIGFIAQSRMDGLAIELGYPGKDLLILTPGVGLDSRGDGKGQQYRTPKEVVEESGCDVIIVGRGIYGDGKNLDVSDVRAKAERYQSEGWLAYRNRLAS